MDTISLCSWEVKGSPAPAFCSKLVQRGLVELDLLGGLSFLGMRVSWAEMAGVGFGLLGKRVPGPSRDAAGASLGLLTKTAGTTEGSGGALDAIWGAGTALSGDWAGVSSFGGSFCALTK